MADQGRDAAAGRVLHLGTALLVAFMVGTYAALLAVHGETLWALHTYGPALSVPGGVVTWGVAGGVASLTVLAGIVAGRESVIGAGSTLAMFWLASLATMFAVSSASDASPVAQPGVLAYTVLAGLAAIRAGVAVGRR